MSKHKEEQARCWEQLLEKCIVKWISEHPEDAEKSQKELIEIAIAPWMEATFKKDAKGRYIIPNLHDDALFDD